MHHDPINQVRYRSLIVALWLGIALMLSAVVIAWRMPDAHWTGWVTFAVAALLMLAMLPVAAVFRHRQRRDILERIAIVTLAVGGLAVFQRMVWYAAVQWPEEPGEYLFRPVFHFTPFFFIATVLLLPSRRALTVCWVAWGLYAAVTVIGVYRATGLTLEGSGELSLLIWTLLANPMFILLLHALPRYEDALDQSTAELAEMRSRAELAEKLAESEQRFNLVVQGLQVGVWDRWTGQTERRWWSPRFFELIGYSPDEIEPSEETLKAMLHPEDRDRVWAQGTEQLQNGDIMDVNFRLNTRHAGYRWFNSHAKAERDAKGRIIRLAGAIADIHEQRTATEKLQQAQAELTRLAYRDTLTDLYNRRYFDEQFQRELARAQRKDRPVSLLLLDLDYFKAYNDRYGHQAGDSCLVEISYLLARAMNRPADVIARLGGEEFAVLLPETPEEGARQVAERLHRQVQNASIEHRDTPSGRVTVSVGIASLDGGERTDMAELFEQADRALYEVKRRGRDGVLHYRDLPPPAAAKAV